MFTFPNFLYAARQTNYPNVSSAAAAADSQNSQMPHSPSRLLKLTPLSAVGVKTGFANGTTGARPSGNEK